MEEKKKKSPLVIALATVLTVLITISLLFTGLRAGSELAHLSFYSRARKEFYIPGTNSGFIGQGLDYLEEQNSFLTCGYSAKKGGASMVYFIDEKGSSKKTLLKNADGSNYTGHTGGIAHYKEFVYITGDDGCDVFALSDFVENKGESKMLGSVKTLLNPAYCNVFGGKFYTGSFYRKGNYETPDWQRIITPAGDENKSVITVFIIDDNAKEAFYINPEPVEAYSTASLVQGMTFTENEIVLSTSYGIAASHLKFYEKSGIVAGQLNLNGKNVPLYFLDSSNLTRNVKAPAMSEEIVYLNGRIYIMCESASNKYIFGKFTRGQYLWSYEV